MKLKEMEYKFNGKRVSDDEWIEGNLIVHKLSDREGDFIENIYYIAIGIGTSAIQIIPETICQFTGLIDKDGVEIYANDIRKDNLNNTFRIYQTEGGFAIKASYWGDDINNLTPSDALILTPLVDAQTRSWLENSTTHVRSFHDSPELIK